MAMDVAMAGRTSWAMGPRPRCWPAPRSAGIFPPLESAPCGSTDGGLVANVPMWQALAMGARSLVVLDCDFPGHVPDPPAGRPRAVRTVLVTMRAQPTFEAPAGRRQCPGLVYLHGPVPLRASPLDFR